MSTSTTVKVVLRPKPGHEKLGYVAVRTTTNRKSKYKSLGIQLSKTHWDETKQRVKATLKKDYKRYNETIEFTLQRLNSNLNNIEVIKSSSITISQFWHHHNKGTSNPGTLSIRQSSLKKFERFLLTHNLDSLRFQDLTPSIIQDYYLFLLKDISLKSAKTYIGYFKSVVNQALKQQIIPSYPVNPFLNLKIPPFKNKKAKALSIAQIKQIMDFNLPQKQAMYRDMFCFQILGGGMRIRDMLLLRWNNIMINSNGIYLQYVQQKTHKQITSKLSIKALGYLHFIFKESHPRQLHDVAKNLHQLNKYLEFQQQRQHKKQYAAINKGENIDDFRFDDFEQGKRNELNKMTRSEASRLTIEENIKIYTTKVTLGYSEIFNDFLQKIPNSYIFHLLKGLEIRDNRSISKETNFQIQGKIAVINYHLKKICEYLEVPKITTHQARHSFTQLLVDSNTNLHFIQQMLGHSSLGVTQNYVASLHTTRLDEISDTIASHF